VLDVAVLGGGGILVTAGLIAGAALCGALCAITLGFYCEDCFKKDFSYAQWLYGQLGNASEEIHSSHWFAGGPTTTLQGRETSPVYHFMSNSSSHDDKDGLDFRNSQPGNHSAAFMEFVDYWQELTPPTLVIPVLTFMFTGYGPSVPRIDWGKSRRSIDNYQIYNSKDGMPDSSPIRDAYYWDTTNVTSAIFPPADNMAYYWWYKWLYARKKDYLTCKPGQPYGLYPLESPFMQYRTWPPSTMQPICSGRITQSTKAGSLRISTCMTSIAKTRIT
jgi:hypothetical protein